MQLRRIADRGLRGKALDGKQASSRSQHCAYAPTRQLWCSCAHARSGDRDNKY